MISIGQQKRTDRIVEREPLAPSSFVSTIGLDWVSSAFYAPPYTRTCNDLKRDKKTKNVLFFLGRRKKT